MASIQEPEVQFAQRLASNEKPIRTKAIKKLRKYINVRSQKATGGFTGDELLKLWKGLFYCLWMQDKPQLQEDLSNQISTLIHSFHDIDGQFLFLESFLQTFKREWTGIDRLRMDKFFQLVRFMFRQTFELLKRRKWDSSVVSRFLELLTAQLLQSGSGAPSGLQFHILDLYMTELAAVGSAELTADQNLTFIYPFCKTAAKTKDVTLFRAICNSIFSSIIDQAPFAIEDLMKEVKAAEDSDSGQASDSGDEEDQLKEKRTEPVSKKGTRKQINANKSNGEEGDDDDDDELLHLEDSARSCDDDIGPVLQFDYAALAAKLFELASRSSTPSHNRQRLYKIIKVLRDLSEGVFPQDDYPEEVSTDEDDEMFGSRKRIKRSGGQVEKDVEEAPAAKKSKGKKKETSTPNNQNKDLGKDDNEPADPTAKKKRKKKKKKARQGGNAGGEENAGQEQIVSQSSIGETDGGLCSQGLGKDAQMHSSTPFEKVTEEATPESRSETLLPNKQLSDSITEETSLPTPCTTDNKDPSEKLSKKNLTKGTCEVTEAAGEQKTPVRKEPKMSSESSAPVSGQKKKKKGLKAKLQTDGQAVMAESQLNAETEITPVSSEQSAERNMTAPETDAITPAKKKKKGPKAKKNLEEVDGESQVNGVSAESDFTSVSCEDSAAEVPTIRLELTDSTIPVNKRKKKNLKADVAQKIVADAQLEVEGRYTDAEITSAGEEATQDITAVPLKKKTKKRGKQEDTTLIALTAADETTVTPLKMTRKKTQKDSKITVEEEGAAVETPQVGDAEKLLFESTVTTPAKKKKKTLTPAQVDDIKDQLLGSVNAELPLDGREVFSSSRKPAKKKKRKVPVTFEFEADELEAAAQEAASINGHAEETVAKKAKLGTDVFEPSTPLSTKKAQKKAKTSSGSPSDFITFQSSAAVPTPLFCKIKGSSSTPLSSKKKSQTPKSESKKVTFGLKNNKTAEFRKTDRSLLVSPDGSSRVPFDPKQKPRFGVLKSPPTPPSASIKTTPNSYRKTNSNTAKSTPKRRPSAADFF